MKRCRFERSEREEKFIGCKTVYPYPIALQIRAIYFQFVDGRLNIFAYKMEALTKHLHQIDKHMLQL